MGTMDVLDQVSAAAALPVFAAQRRREQWLPRSALAALRERRLVRLLARARRAPYYRRLFEERDIPAGAGSAALHRLPPLDRAQLAEHGIASFLTRSRAGLLTVSTSGSTGRPAIFLRSPREEAEFSARWARVYAAYGCGPCADQVNVASGQNRTRRGAIDLLRRMRLLPRVIALASSAPTEEVLETVRRVRPTILTGYAVAIEALAERALADARPITPPRAVFCTSMEVTEHCLGLAARAFRSAVSNVYVTNEVGVVAWSCPARHDALHLNEDVLLVEVVDDRGRPVPEGVCGELLVTPLGLRAMPLLRYRLGDLAARLPGDCGCGRSLALITPVQGRTAHTIRGSRGELVTAPLVAAAVGQSGAHDWSRRFQLRETETGELRLLVEATRTPGAAERRSLLEGVQALIGPGHSVGLEIVPSLPLAPSGKFQHVVPRAAGRGQRPPQAA